MRTDRDACYTGMARSHTFVCGRRKSFTRRHVRGLVKGRVEPPQSPRRLIDIRALDFFSDSLRPTGVAAPWRGILPARRFGRSVA